MKKIVNLLLILAMLMPLMTVGNFHVIAAYENTHVNTGDQRLDIVAIAQTQIGYYEGTNNNNKYGAYFGNNYYSWCAYFVIWCARQAGISSSIIETTGWACADDMKIPYYSKQSYTPKSGDIIFFNYPDTQGQWDHVGIVERVNSDGSIVTIEGNSEDAVRRNTYSSQYNGIRGYGVPNYKGDNHSHTYTGSYFEAAHPHREYQTCSCGETKYTGKTKAYSNCSTCMKISQGYVQPVKAYTINTGKTTVYDAVSGSAKSNKIYDTDLCTINEIYDCGWCKVTFPLDAGGSETGYVKIGVFMKSGGFISYASSKLTTYSRSDLSTSIGYASAGDKIYILGNTSTAVQIAYPLSSGGWKVGWVSISLLKATMKYNSNGGTGTMANTTAYYGSDFTLTNNNFSKAGHSFSGWNVYRSSDKTWYVKGTGWKTSAQINSEGYEKSIYKNGFTANYNKSWMSLGKTNEVLTFYAIWTPNTLSVCYNANGGSVNSDHNLSNNIICYADGSKRVQTWKYNSTQTNGLINDTTFGLTRTGYTFKGWGTTSTGGTIFDQNDKGLLPTEINTNIKNGNCSTTLYAIWVPNTLSVYYNANGGSVNSDHKLDNNIICYADGSKRVQTWKYNSTQTNGLINDKTFGLTRTGYTFKGWGTTSTGGTIFDQNDKGLLPTEINTNIKNGSVSTTLYAIWEKGCAVHTPANVWSSNSEYHWKECSVVGCGIVIDGSKVLHSSNKAENKATCQKQAVCDVCGVSYGKVASHSYTLAEKKQGALKIAGNCRDKAVYYYSCSVCGLIENNDNHTFFGDKVVTSHVGGTTLVGKVDTNHKTQTDGYTGDTKCLGCNEIIAHGQTIPAGAHTPANAWSNNSEYHWHICTVAGCGAVIDNSKRLHTPDRDAATETDPIKCSICDYVITPALGHTHAHGNEWKSDDNNHWKECTCGNKANVSTHTDTDKDGKCDVCKYNVGLDVTTNLAGDINTDGIINAIDVLNIRRYVVGGWNIAFDTSLADVTSDDFVNSKDAVKIRRSISGGW